MANMQAECIAAKLRRRINRLNDTQQRWRRRNTKYYYKKSLSAPINTLMQHMHIRHLFKLQSIDLTQREEIYLHLFKLQKKQLVTN